VLDSGNIILEVSVPSISGSFQSGRNFYSSQEGKLDYSNQAKNIQEQSEHTLERLEEMASKVDDPRLEQAREKLEQAAPSSPARPIRKRPSRRWTTCRKPSACWR
jgi:molecular chaperone DnaK